MKIALVHDYLNQVGGGERVLDELMLMFPQAQIYTLMYDSDKTMKHYDGRIAKTSFLDFQFARDHHRLFIPFMPMAIRGIQIPNDVDLIISDSAGFGKGIKYNKKTTKHLCYIHTPLRYAWETKNYFPAGKQILSLSRLKNLSLRILGAPAFWFVRWFDYWSAQQPNRLVANSEYIADKVKKYYGRLAEVVYPPVSDFWFSTPSASSRLKADRSSYYLAAGRLLHYKRFDLIIEAFAELKFPLKIAGTGPELSSLKLISSQLGAPVEFLGFVKGDDELRELYQNAKAFIMANEEDFGLVTAEAQACGTPVIAYGRGGSLEIINKLGIKNKEAGDGPRVITSELERSTPTGIFFNEQTPEALVAAVKKIEVLEFDREKISDIARQFNIENFKNGVNDAVQKLLGE